MLKSYIDQEANNVKSSSAIVPQQVFATSKSGNTKVSDGQNVNYAVS